MVEKGTYRTKEEKARIVMEVLSNTSTIAEICRKYNVASSKKFGHTNMLNYSNELRKLSGKSGSRSNINRRLRAS
jgi:hypothetical protein